MPSPDVRFICSILSTRWAKSPSISFTGPETRGASYPWVARRLTERRNAWSKPPSSRTGLEGMAGGSRSDHRAAAGPAATAPVGRAEEGLRVGVVSARNE
jgi:hypothetical protein